MGELSELQGQTQGETLEAVYEKFNIDHLADYKGHCSCDSPSFVRALALHRQDFVLCPAL